MQIKLKALPHFHGLASPSYQTAQAAGFDIAAAVEAPFTLSVGQRAAIPTGLAMEIAEGFEVQIRPRSGLALKNGITCLNTPGTIDADFRGEVKIILANLGQEDFIIERGMRIAQAVLAPVSQADISFVDELSDTERGTGGFGSTGS